MKKSRPLSRRALSAIRSNPLIQPTWSNYYRKPRRYSRLGFPILVLLIETEQNSHHRASLNDRCMSKPNPNRLPHYPSVNYLRPNKHLSQKRALFVSASAQTVPPRTDRSRQADDIAAPELNPTMPQTPSAAIIISQFQDNEKPRRKHA